MDISFASNIRGFFQFSSTIAPLQPTSIGNNGNQGEGQSAATDSVALSPESRDIRSQQDAQSSEKGTPKKADKLSDAELQQLQQLKKRDTEVRNHELAHLAAAGQYARSGASYTYEKGPDGVSYAIGGEVSIDLGKERTPEATIAKMETIKRAALAPLSPSPADRSIAAQAAFIESQSRQELYAKQQQDLLKNIAVKGPETGTTSSTTEQNTATNTGYPHSAAFAIATYQRIAKY